MSISVTYKRSDEVRFDQLGIGEAFVYAYTKDKIPRTYINIEDKCSAFDIIAAEVMIFNADNMVMPASIEVIVSH